MKTKVFFLGCLLTSLSLSQCKDDKKENGNPTVDVDPVLITDIAIDAPPAIMYLNEEVTLTATPTPLTNDDEPITWDATPSGIVELTPDGRTVTVKALAAGTATITATSASGGAENSVTTEVVPYLDVLTNTQAPLEYYLNGSLTMLTEWTANEQTAVDGGTAEVLNDLGGGIPCMRLRAMGGDAKNYMNNGKIYQTVVLDAGDYQLSIKVDNLYRSGSSEYFSIYLVAALGAGLPDAAQVATALQSASIQAITSVAVNGTYSIDFTLTEREVVSLGLVADFHRIEMYISQVNLQKM